MVVRIWRGWTSIEDASAYVEHLQAATLPALHRLPGFEGAEILRRETRGEVEFLVRTSWSSREAIVAFAGEQIELPVIPPEAGRLLVRFDPTVAHFDRVDE